MSALRTVWGWHRPLVATAVLMALCALVSLVGLAVDARTLGGLDVWAKPLKFSLSILLYSVTWAWLISRLSRWRRAAHRAGTVIAIALVVEQIAIVGSAAAGVSSHFNVSTPLATAVWAVMATAITILYIATLVTTIALAFLRLPDRSLLLAVRAGAARALLGLGLAFLMTSPTSSQLDDFRGVAGAHTVGLPDGGPGLPILGWSTVGGDLRIPHFIGMHALQIIPLAAVALAALGRRVRHLADERVRSRVVVILSGAYLAVVALVTTQAVAGESVVDPSVPTIAAGTAITVGVLVASLLVLRAQPDGAQPVEQMSAPTRQPTE